MRPFSILILDDEEIILQTLRDALKDFLKRGAVECQITCCNPLNQDPILIKDIFDLIIIDMQIGQLKHGGLSIIRSFREKAPNLQFLVYTGYPSHDLLSLTEDMKPIDIAIKSPNLEGVKWSVQASINKILKWNPEILNAKEPSFKIYEYNSVSQLLSAYIKFKKSLNHHYSMEILARRTGYKSRGSIWAIINGSMILTQNRAFAIGRNMDIGPRGISYLCALAGFESAKDEAEKCHFLRELKEINPAFLPGSSPIKACVRCGQVKEETDTDEP